MRESGISFRTEGGYSVGVYRTTDEHDDSIMGRGKTESVIRRIGVIYFGTDKKWCFSHMGGSDNCVPTLEHLEMHDIIGMMNSLARTDNYGHPDEKTFR
jgi:hypothetical protein